MQIARDSGRIARTYSDEQDCPWCKTNKLRYDIEFQVMSFENGKTLELNETVKGFCSHCLTICNELPRLDFLCAKCGQLTMFQSTDINSEWGLFIKTFSRDCRFEEFYKLLQQGGLIEGKRFCLQCVDRVWHEYKANPEVLQKELKKPKPTLR